ncbi:MAG: DUF4175 domain-containing protein [Saprospiraceae bacterium]|nr:DUF4175 domain-containing protein [Saprospiraceae bacterium]
MDIKLSNYQILIEKLDRFIRKFYINKILRGAILFSAIVLALFLIFNLLESQFYFSRAVRKLIYYSFIGISLSSLAFFVLVPLSKYFRLGKVLSHENAAIIIGNHFSNVKDKLLNVLQLYGQSQSDQDNELLFASIDQKSEEIKIVPFRTAVNLQSNRRYLKYLLPPALFLLLLLLFAPGIIKSSTKRIINNNIDFLRPAPFEFKIVNKSLEAVQYSDMTLKVKIEGETLPADVYIDIEDFQYRLTKTGPDEFEYVFKNIQEDMDFQLYSGRVKSENYEIKVIPKPVITDFSIYVDYPSYTGQKDELIKNTGDLLVLEGSVLRWDFNSMNTDLLKMNFLSDKNKRYLIESDGGNFRFTRKIINDDIYKLYIVNNRISVPDSMSYSINVVKDKFPTINIEQVRDSLDDSMIYFIGNVSDDYGFSSLSFNYRVGDKDGSISGVQSKKLTISKAKNFDFRYILDFADISLKPGQVLKYYFEVKDNDGINGPKSSVSGEMEYRTISEDEFDKQENQNEEDIKKNLEKIQQEAKKIREKLRKLREKLMQKKEAEWQDKKELEKLLEKEKELQKMLEDAKNKLEENLKKQQDFKKLDESILNKQEQLQKMFEESLSQEQKDLMQKIEELMKELQKDEMMEQMDQMNLDEEKLEKQMDRMLELFKQLELEKEISESIKELNKMAEKQEKLSEETKDKAKPNEELKKEQQELNKEFDKTKEKVEDLMKKNEELEHPKNLAKDNKEKMEEIEQDMEKSDDQIKENKNSGASQSQKSAAQKMKKMAKSLEMQMEGSEKEQHEEDLKALRQLLENLLTLSFDQESLMKRSGSVIVNSPAFKKVLVDQHKISEDFKIVEDSLHALSKRVVEIQSFVNDKVREIKGSIDQSLKKLQNDDQFPGSRDFPGANKAQHESMKGLNDLALMLDESMQQMQKNGSGMPGSGSCNKPGGSGKKPGKSGKEPMDKIAKGQEKLTEKMKQMLSQMQGKSGKGGMPKEFAEAAKQQAELRKALEQLKREKQEEGKGGGNELQKMIDDMNRLEEDLVNKRLDGQLIKRQQDITNRLLEADKADRQRGFENERKSETGTDKERKLPPAIEKYLKERESQLDIYRSVSPTLKPFYRDLVRDYIEKMKNNK